jgi:hypothetical protein
MRDVGRRVGHVGPVPKEGTLRPLLRPRAPRHIAKQIHYGPLPEDMRIVPIRRWKNFGMLPATTVEKMVPAREQPATTSV